MTDQKRVVHEVRQAIHGYFEWATDPIQVPQQLMEMTGHEAQPVIQAVMTLERKGEIEGPVTLQPGYLTEIWRYNLP